MKSPFTGGEVIFKLEKREIPVRKEVVEIMFHFYQCVDTGEQFTTDELDEKNLIQAWNAYRAKLALPFPEEIASIRKKYGLSASKMSDILGFGANVYRNYEAGEVPNQSNARLIQMVNDPVKFKELLLIWATQESHFADKHIKKVDALIDALHQANDDFPSNMQEFIFGKKAANIFSGYKIADPEKIAAMVLFFSQKLEPWKTKLNKLMFYSDFLHFKRTCFSISGLNYRAIDMGPVPMNFNSIFDFLENSGKLWICRTEFSNGGIGEQFKISPSQNVDFSVLSDIEIQTLTEVAEKMGPKSTDEIISLSHNEIAWKENFDAGKRLISYEYGFQLLAV